MDGRERYSPKAGQTGVRMLPIFCGKRATRDGDMRTVVKGPAYSTGRCKVYTTSDRPTPSAASQCHLHHAAVCLGERSSTCFSISRD